MQPQSSKTLPEILAQPQIWSDWRSELERQAALIRDWIAEKEIEEVILAGAGTSAFIGDVLAFVPSQSVRVRAIPTTDIVSCPFDCLRNDPRLLVVQFGRSGDSSESVGTLDLLDRAFPLAQRLNITCNPKGTLASRTPVGPGEQRVIALPAETHDSGFAMTSSFTTMLLSALACFDGATPAATRLAELAAKAQTLLPQLIADAPARPSRAVFLGSGALKGVARESALKVLELTAGQTMTSWDSTLGFRHGPKAVITGADLIVVMIHPDPHTALYDRDVANEIKLQYPDATVLTIGAADCDIDARICDDARWEAPLYVLAAQVWGVVWSGALGLNIDNPFEGQGNLSRVVSGVTLYPVNA